MIVSQDSVQQVPGVPVNVVDTTPPVITCPADVLNLACGDSTAPSNTGVATATAADVQTVGQSAASDQQAGAASGATQIDPSNTNISVRVLSDGNDGPVTQSTPCAALPS